MNYWKLGCNCDTAEHPDTIAGRPFCGNRQAYCQAGVEA